ncbi:uncharacterized protein J7T54_005658 [Emericellopsis cladophorae]|uniref:Thioesterase family protein n=1 Tax=Emericellopsis cladophorae TaxID=2686198 RepID=A0A9P9Y644_9HYPO|nr:uncharacterized protein J7T54_005658 [Emericellopsis cladophorae]KAI6783629.1 hypothetical protein J7T54_005658 [Emericellopsis cladophorae]
MVKSSPAALASLCESIEVRRVDDGIYEADLALEFCVGTVPNGGYVASIFAKVAEAHLLPRNQPHIISAHWTFMAKTKAGRALVKVLESKIGRATSVLHVSLHQQDILPQSPWIPGESPACVAAYMTSGNLDEEAGVTLPTQWKLEYEPPAIDHERAATDANWAELDIPILKKVPMLHHLKYYIRRSGHVLPTTHDYWVHLTSGENFTQTSLGYLADTGPPLVVEAFRPPSTTAPIPEGGFTYSKGFWYPTLTMTLDVRRKLPEEGAKWLRLRVTTKEIRNGRYDAEVVMFDKDGQLVALSNHVSMAVDIERNYGGRRVKM